MNMVTIKDIAKAAGVSHGTVSNVLNKRGNVSASKIKIVEETAKKLGYYVNSQAQLLRKSNVETYYVVLFDSDKKRYNYFINELMITLPHVELVMLKKKSECALILQELIAKVPSTIITIGFSPKNYVDVKNSTIPFVEVGTYQSTHSIQFNSGNILQKLEQLKVDKQLQSFCLVTDTLERKQTLFYALGQLHPNMTCHFVKDNLQLIFLYDRLKQLGHKDCLVLDNEQLLHDINSLYDWFGKEDRPHICFIGVKKWIKNDWHSYIDLDYYHLASQCIATIQQISDSTKVPLSKQEVIWRSTKKRSETVLTLLTIASPMSKVLTILSQRYYKLTGVKLNVLERTYDELLNMIEQDTSLEGVDMIRMDMAWLPTHVEKICQALPLKKVEHINRKIANQLSKEYTHINQKQYTFPLDISSQVLVYRKDIFDNPFIQRQYYELYKQKLVVPQSFHAYDELSKFFTKSFNPMSPTTYAHSMALKLPVQATCDFTPRFREAVLLHHMDMSKITEAFEQYKNSFQYTQNSFSKWWGEFTNALSQGETVMEIIFSNYVSPLLSFNNDTSYEFGIANVPGNNPVIGGGVIGITQQSTALKECIMFIDWLYSEEISVLLTALGGFIPSQAVLSNKDLQKQLPWLTSFDTIFKMGSRTKWHEFETDFNYERLLGQEIIDTMKELYNKVE